MSATWAQKHQCIFLCVGSEARATPSLQDCISSFVMVRKRKEDNRTEEERNRTRKKRGKRDRRGRKYPMCIAKGCPAFGQRGWCGGYCKKCAPKYGRSRPVQVQKQKKAKVENTKNDEMGPPIEAEMEAQRKVTGEAIEKKCKVERPRTKNSEPRAQAPQCARQANDSNLALERRPGYNHYPKDSEAFLNADLKDLHPDLDEDEGSGWKIQQTNGGRNKRWPKEVRFVPKLCPITLPTMESKRPMRMPRSHLGRRENARRMSYAMELAELPFETIMSM